MELPLIMFFCIFNELKISPENTNIPLMNNPG
jgi:hypothetical protein